MLTCFTNDDEMGPLREDTDFIDRKTAEVVAYLNADPRNAVVLNNQLAQMAVWRGASEQLNNFYWQDLPLEDPDSNGGDLTAEEAIEQAWETPTTR